MESWPLVRLDSLYDIARGGSPRPIKKFITEDPDGVNWIKISDATSSEKYIYETKQKIIPEGIQRSRFVNKGDFILSNSMSFGRPYIMRTTGCIHDGWLVLSPKNQLIDQDFLYYILGSPFVFQQFDSLAAGSTVRNLNIDLVKSVKIPLLPIEEQKRIVAILDQVFADIEKARATAETNLKNARELFDSCLELELEKYSQHYVELSSITDVKVGTHDSPKYVETGIPFVTQKNIGKEGLHFNGVKYISNNDHEHFYKRSNVSKGDILISMIGANRGMSCIVDNSKVFSIKNVGLIKFSKQINMNFLLLYLKSASAKRFVERESRGGAQPFIGLTKLRKFPIPSIDLMEQERISNRIDEIKKLVETLETSYVNKIEKLDELKKAILHKAFTGELTKSKGIAA